MTTWLSQFEGSHDVVFATLLDMHFQGIDQGEDTTRTLANLRAAVDEWYALNPHMKES